MQHLWKRLHEYEMGRLSEEEVLALFQELVDSRVVWQLQGIYGRRAAQLIEAGLIKPKDPESE